MSVIAVIIPTLDEASTIRRTLEALSRCQDIEVFVSDGGSCDGTVRIAQEFDITMVRSDPGKGAQMNCAARLTTAPILLFMHADTALPQGWQDIVCSTLEGPGVAAGAFCLGIEGSGLGVRLIERITNLRSRYLQTPYGDQAIFVRSELFQKIGGYSEIPIMEDFDLVRRLARQGRIVTAHAAVTTSGRRWKKLGLIKTTLINWTIVLAYALGFSAESLSRWYARESSKMPAEEKVGRGKSEEGDSDTSEI